MKIITSKETRDTFTGAREFLNEVRKIPGTSFAIGILFGGDRWSCVTDLAIAQNGDEKTIGLATFAKNGEQGDGIPCIVGILVHPDERGKGYGTILLEAACQMGLEQIGEGQLRIDIMSKAMQKIVKKLPDDIQNRLDIIEHDFLMDVGFFF